MRRAGWAAGLLLPPLLVACGGGTPTADPSPTVSVIRPATTSPVPTRTLRVPPTPVSIVPTDLPTDVPLPPPTTGVGRLEGALLGGDASWPQCPKGMGIPQKRSLGSPMPTAEARFVVLGLTNGPGFVRNPCLPAQVAFARQRHLFTAAYAVASYPDAATRQRYAASGPFDAGDRLGALANAGYQQARFNVTSLLSTGLGTPIVWIDVEPVPDFEWSSDRVANAAVVRGLARGYADAGYRIGVYSTPYLWQGVVGDLRLGDLVPEWRAAGQTSQAEAVARCGEAWSIQGGPGVLGQWVAGGRDLDVTCPGVGDLSGLFARSS